MNPNPLVSVNVVSYNAENYVIETLDSIKNQTYQNIELIISDDASTDSTVDLCKKWLEVNSNRFVFTQLLTVKKNTGVSANCQRALEASHGLYRKGIGSDDVLIPDAIENFVKYVRNNPNAKLVFANEIRFVGNLSDMNFTKCILPFRALCFRKSVTAKQQYTTLTKGFIGCAPTAFISIEALKEVGGFNDTYKTEDGPLYIAFTQKGYKLHHMNEFVIYRRVHPASMTHLKNKKALIRSVLIKNDGKKSWKDCQYEHSNFIWKICSKYNEWMIKKIHEHGNSRSSLLCYPYYFLYIFTNPYRWEYYKMKFCNAVLVILGY